MIVFYSNLKLLHVDFLATQPQFTRCSYLWSSKVGLPMVFQGFWTSGNYSPENVLDTGKTDAHVFPRLMTHTSVSLGLRSTFMQHLHEQEIKRTLVLLEKRCLRGRSGTGCSDGARGRLWGLKPGMFCQKPRISLIPINYSMCKTQQKLHMRVP